MFSILSKIKPRKLLLPNVSRRTNDLIESLRLAELQVRADSFPRDRKIQQINSEIYGAVYAHAEATADKFNYASDCPKRDLKASEARKLLEELAIQLENALRMKSILAFFMRKEVVIIAGVVGWSFTTAIAVLSYLK